MSYDRDEALAILERTPRALDGLLRDLPDAWARWSDSDGSWSAYDVVGHLLHGERTDWIPRAEIVLAGDPAATFTPFDRFAQANTSAGKSLNDLLGEFA